ncbi:GTP pyrophosphokinase, partial [Bacillus sp. JJ783]
MVEKVERLISEINKLHKQYSNDYFDTGKVDKVNLSRTIKNVPERHILNYRLNLHESINDYLMKADTDDIKYFYRVKTSESILDKINRYLSHTDQYPVNNWLNDIFGCRMILSADEI